MVSIPCLGHWLGYGICFLKDWKASRSLTLEALPTTENGTNHEAWRQVFTQRCWQYPRSGLDSVCLASISSLTKSTSLIQERFRAKSQVFVVCSRTEEMVHIHYAEQRRHPNSVTLNYFPKEVRVFSNFPLNGQPSEDSLWVLLTTSCLW